MSRTHELKCWPSFFAGIWDKSKTFEVRKNDRDFMVGDLLVLMEWNPAFHETGEGDAVHEGMTGRECRRVVTYVLRGGEFGIAQGHCVLGLALPDATQAEAPTSALESSIRALDAAHDAEVEKARREGRDAGLREAMASFEAALRDPDLHADNIPGLRLAIRRAARIAESAPTPAPDVASLQAVAEAALLCAREGTEDNATWIRLLDALDAAGMTGWRTAS